MRLAEHVVPVVVRMIGGLMFAGLGALAGMALAGISLPPGTDRTYLLAARVVFIGLGASAGGFLPWWRPGEDTRTTALRVSLILAGSTAGALAGLAFADVFQEHYDPLRRVQQISRTMVYGASIGANVLTLLLDLRAVIVRRSR
ncbi:MAG: hypothetical protein HYY34_06415 [Chloroflexi bacterium]|nr:hypothetical protein [Chloroflexota bacterium]